MFFKKSLTTLHGENKGKVSDKWEKFLATYEKLFEPIRGRQLRMLEIGVQNGGSLDVWSKYFHAAQKIIGCDIDPLCGSLRYDDTRIKVVVGDANSKGTREAIVSLSPSFDLIIDDGSHVSSDVIASFLLYFPLLNPEGIFVIEDTHTLYWSEFGGGLERGGSAKEFFKDLTDVVNFEHWRSSKSIGEHIISKYGPMDCSEIESGWVDSVEFHNSLIIVRKSSMPTHYKLGARVITGATAIVSNGPVEMRGKEASGN